MTNDTKAKIIVYGGIVAVICSLIGGCSAFYLGSKDTVIGKVEKTERVKYEDSSKYLIFCENETFENTDTILFGKWNSSDVYGRIKEGRTYRFTVVGWRIPILSGYRNIIDVQELPTPKPKKEAP